MKYLFVVNHAHYLRHYGPVVHALAARGHEVEIVFSAERADCTARLARWQPEHARIRHVPAPDRNGWWWSAADPLRALRDYLQYLHPAYKDAPKLFERVARRVPGYLRRALDGQRSRRSWLVDRLEQSLAVVERSLQSDPGISDWLAARSPDAVLVSPLVDLDYFQLDVLKGAMSMGIPTGYLVASWDNLTTKGRIQLAADIVVVWNETQRREAIELHGVPADRIVVTGAQLYDLWFEMQPRDDRATFCARVGGLDPTQPIILYVCSSQFICPNETEFVAQWVREIRSDPELRKAGILVRPHPQHAEQWRNVNLEGTGRTVIWPSAGAMPIGKQEVQDYFDSLWHAAAVVGINTSVFLEAAIVGRPTLTPRTPSFADTQDGTLHFQYIVEGGLLSVGDTPGKHLAQLRAAVRDDPSAKIRMRTFISGFLRPRGLDKPATPFVVDALESLASRGRKPALAAPRLAPLIRALLAPFAVLYLKPHYQAVLAKREEREQLNVLATNRVEKSSPKR